MQKFNTILADRFSKDARDKERWARIITEVYKGTPTALGFAPEEYSDKDLELLSFAYGQLSNPRYDKNRFKLLNQEVIITARDIALSLYREMLKRNSRNILALQGAAYMYYKFAIISVNSKQKTPEIKKLKEKFQWERYEYALKAERIYRRLLTLMPRNITANYRYANMLQTNMKLYRKEGGADYVKLFHIIDRYYELAKTAYEILEKPEDKSKYAAMYAKALFGKAELYQDSVHDNYTEEEIWKAFTANPDAAVAGYKQYGISRNVLQAKEYLFQLIKFLNIDVSVYNFKKEATRQNLNKQPVKHDFIFNRIAKTYAYLYRYQCFTTGRCRANTNMLEEAFYYALLTIQFDTWYNTINYTNRNILSKTYTDLLRISGLKSTNPMIQKAKSRIPNFMPMKLPK